LVFQKIAIFATSTSTLWLLLPHVPQSKKGKKKPSQLVIMIYDEGGGLTFHE
jgi:hypothetical protein